MIISLSGASYDARDNQQYGDESAFICCNGVPPESYTGVIPNDRYAVCDTEIGADYYKRNSSLMVQSSSPETHEIENIYHVSGEQTLNLEPRPLDVLDMAMLSSLVYEDTDTVDVTMETWWQIKSTSRQVADVRSPDSVFETFLPEDLKLHRVISGGPSGIPFLDVYSPSRNVSIIVVR